MVLYSTYTYKLLSDGTNQGRFNIFWNNLSVGVFYISGSIPDSREIENGKSSVACMCWYILYTVQIMGIT
jgi:hypothetical protein